MLNRFLLAGFAILLCPQFAVAQETENGSRCFVLHGNSSAMSPPQKRKLKRQSFVILSVAKDQKLVVYSIGKRDGALTQLSETETTGKPGASIVDPSGEHLYVAMKETNSIAAFKIGRKAKLTLIGETVVGAAPSYLAIDLTGKFLLSSYYAEGQVAVHAIAADGILGASPHLIIKTDERAHCINLDPSGRFAFVPHTRPQAIFQFVFDAETGNLSANETAKLIRKADSGPRHIWFHPTNGHAYGSDEQGSSVTTYALDASSGELAVVETVSSLPESGFEGKNSTSDIEVHPSGRFVFVANRGHDSIASFSIDVETGKLALLEHAPTAPTTRSFNISPNGKHLVAAGQKSNELRVFRISEDGKLKLQGTYDCGQAPWWVQIIER